VQVFNAQQNLSCIKPRPLFGEPYILVQVIRQITACNTNSALCEKSLLIGQGRVQFAQVATFKYLWPGPAPRPRLRKFETHISGK
jgi:hypothetical protein